MLARSIPSSPLGAAGSTNVWARPLPHDRGSVLVKAGTELRAPARPEMSLERYAELCGKLLFVIGTVVYGTDQTNIAVDSLQRQLRPGLLRADCTGQRQRKVRLDAAIHYRRANIRASDLREPDSDAVIDGLETSCSASTDRHEPRCPFTVYALADSVVAITTCPLTVRASTALRRPRPLVLTVRARKFTPEGSRTVKWTFVSLSRILRGHKQASELHRILLI